MTQSLILRTRPTVVEAKRLSDDNQEEIARWVGGWTYGVTCVRWFDRDTGRIVAAEVGDWIVKTAFGHYKPVSDSAIFQQYERVVPAVTE